MCSQYQKVGFKSVISPAKDLVNIQKSKGFKKQNSSRISKNNNPSTTIEIQKLLQENKRLHDRLEIKSKQENELN